MPNGPPERNHVLEMEIRMAITGICAKHSKDTPVLRCEIIAILSDYISRASMRTYWEIRADNERKEREQLANALGGKSPGQKIMDEINKRVKKEGG